MPRRILHHGPNPADTPVEISDRAVSGCWFEWNRQGGCGAGEVKLRDDFADRGAVEPGDWISIESEPGLRWYLGRIESKEATFPAGIRLRLEGMGVELAEIYPGGFGSDVDGFAPQRLGATDLFSLDPDRAGETFDATGDAASVVRLLMSRYVVPGSHISYDPVAVEDSARPSPVDSLKIRGEETARSLIKDLAVRAGAAAWGVDAAGEFFFLQRRTEPALTLQIGQSITELEELSDRELLFNRVLLTGDYIYDRADASDNIAVRSYRWRGNFVEPNSKAAHGERRLRMWIPWIRTQADSLSFVREFFRIYSQPQRRYRVTTGEIAAPVFPWLGTIALRNAAGYQIATGVCDTIRVLFDRVPRLRLEIGPEDPRNLWPEPTQDERWELPARQEPRGGEVSLTSFGGPSSGGGGGGGGGTTEDSTATTETDFSSGSDPATSLSGASDDSDSSSEFDSSGEDSSDDSSDYESDSSDASDSGVDMSSDDTTGDLSSDESDASSSGESDPGSGATTSAASATDGSDDGTSGDFSETNSTLNSETSSDPGGSSGAGDDSSGNDSDDDSSFGTSGDVSGDESDQLSSDASLGTSQSGSIDPSSEVVSTAGSANNSSDSLTENSSTTETASSANPSSQESDESTS